MKLTVSADNPLEKMAMLMGTMTAHQWDCYQRGMRAAANFVAPELAKRIPVPLGARRMLDVGGSHGFYSASICRRHDGLTAEVLDLPDAVAAAAPILAREGMGDRVRHRAGDALTEDLEAAAYEKQVCTSADPCGCVPRRASRWSSRIVPGRRRPPPGTGPPTGSRHVGDRVQQRGTSRARRMSGGQGKASRTRPSYAKSTFQRR